ncbi:MAG: DUF2181 domain-containing protein [Candidatus Paceibacterota bacterium]|jgi:hypothetical protein
MQKFLNYFGNEFPGSNVKSIGDISWAHAVNSREKLDRYLNDGKTMMLESDIGISVTGEIVLAHPKSDIKLDAGGKVVSTYQPETESDLSFEQLLEKLKSSKQGMKFDFKDPEILIDCLKMIRSAGLVRPILLNADILPGNGMQGARFNAAAFIALCRKYLPRGILSIGWTTIADEKYSYTAKNVDDMLALCQSVEIATFPVRACLMPGSWVDLKRLVQKENYTLSIWNNEPVTEKQIEFLKTTDRSKCFYDFIDDKKEPLKIL